MREKLRCTQGTEGCVKNPIAWYVALSYFWKALSQF